MGRKRSQSNAGLPANLYCRNGYFMWRNTMTKKWEGLGSNEAKAIALAIEKNERVLALIEKKTAYEKRHRGNNAAIDENGLYSHEEIVRRSFQYSSIVGVYFLLRCRKVVYVGKSNDVLFRIKQHRLEKLKDFDSAAVIRCELEDLDRLESAYINKLKPEHNDLIPQPVDGPYKLKTDFEFLQNIDWILTADYKPTRKSKFFS